jgi:ribosomal protein L34E
MMLKLSQIVHRQKASNVIGCPKCSAVIHGRNQSRMANPRRDTKTLFPLHPLKSVLVSRPLAGLFSILRARALFASALRSELQTDRHWKRRRIRATQFL